MRHFIIILGFFIFSVTVVAASNLKEVKKELQDVKTKLKSAQGSQKVKLMKKMAKLENQIVEDSGADSNKSKPR